MSMTIDIQFCFLLFKDMVILFGGIKYMNYLQYEQGLLILQIFMIIQYSTVC